MWTAQKGWETNSCSPKEAAALPHLSALFHKTPCFVWGLVKAPSAFIYLLFSPSVCFLRQLRVRDAMVRWGERIIAKETSWKQLDESVKDFRLNILLSFSQTPQGEEVQLPVSSHLGTSKRHPDAHVCSEQPCDDRLSEAARDSQS